MIDDIHAARKQIQTQTNKSAAVKGVLVKSCKQANAPTTTHTHTLSLSLSPHTHTHTHTHIHTHTPTHTYTQGEYWSAVPPISKTGTFNGCEKHLTTTETSEETYASRQPSTETSAV